MPEMYDKSTMMPTGDKPPAPPAKPPAETQDGKGDKRLAGKFSTPEELEKAYMGLESKMGEQGKEMGDLRKQNQEMNAKLFTLVDRLGQQGNTTGTTEPSAPDYDAQVSDIMGKVEEGDLKISEALKKAMDLASAKTLSLAQESFEAMNAQNTAAAAKKAFIEKNPDFIQTQQSGELEKIKAEDPLHDDYSAYFALKARQTALANETAVKEAYEKGKNEQANLEKGVSVTEKVLSGSGTEINQQGPVDPNDDSAMHSSMMGTLAKFRSGK